ncbi:MAG: DUF2175 family protein [Candidatus Nitrosocaldus sp.]|nr:DUF2175 domain-containing protein [Candidatus Nitrosocaldus sp.]MCS7140986.1 DUF2175 domain-containing protein [Candidatus Nitrosocaldus sp.]MDW7999937.1 DUF2175 family protein [Candidatus Nitrosocaldus sp.]MDW8275420.1 DUF2175 family protein [Candidatus Nitrosocaldus sp.]
MSTKWSCAICSKQIAWSELFTFYSKGAVHFTCFRDSVMGKDGSDEAKALVDALEHELRMIVAYKGYMPMVKSDEARRLLEENEKDAEKHAALLTKLIDRRVLQGAGS